MDEENNSTVVIKFAKPGPMAKRLDNEYHHYVLLEAEGRQNLVFHLFVKKGKCFY